MTVHWTISALADLKAVDAYIRRHSPRYADGVVERIFARSAQLADHPRLGPSVAEYHDESLRELYEGSYRIIYRVREQQVDIVAVVHSARRLPRGL